MMPGIRVVLVSVAPFIAAICPGELRAARRAGLLAGMAQCRGERIVCQLCGPVRCRWPCAWPGGPCVVVAAAPAAGCSRSHSFCSAWTWTVNDAALALVVDVRDDHFVDAGVAAGGRIDGLRPQADRGGEHTRPVPGQRPGHAEAQVRKPRKTLEPCLLMAPRVPRSLADLPPTGPARAMTRARSSSPERMASARSRRGNRCELAPMARRRLAMERFIRPPVSSDASKAR